MKKQQYILVILLALSLSSYAQYTIKNVEELKILKELPQEKVYITHTGPLLFTGDYFYYAFNSLNTIKHTYSDLSKIGYILLVNENKEIIIEQKLKLKKGKGQGDFFLSTDIPSGNYKLLGYTHWMKNNGLKQVFKEDVVIINPYKADQSALLDNETTILDQSPDEESLTTKKNSILELQIEEQNFSPRTKVALTLRNKRSNLGYGTYSILVKRKSVIMEKDATNAEEFSEEAKNLETSIKKSLGETIYLPEQKGELIWGKARNLSTGENLRNEKLILSVPGEKFILKYLNTDDQGNFFAYLDRDYDVPLSVVQAENPEFNNINVEYGDKGNLKLDELNLGKFRLSKAHKDAINQRSIHNQIANQYFSVNPDSIILKNTDEDYKWSSNQTSINLDDYTRFSTITETFLELLPNINYKNNADGTDFIRMEMNEAQNNAYYVPKPAIVLIDGVFIPNHEKIRDFNARRIQTISWARDQYGVGGTVYQGMISIKTIDGDFYEEYESDYGSKQELIPAVPRKNYYVQRYDSNTTTYDRIPDYRYILSWQPHLELNKGDLSLEFYTSDVEGEYEIILNGFTSYGKPICLKKSFTVTTKNQ